MPEHYPFAAIVGQDDLKTALILNAIYPAIGGVLIRGEKGTAKSTAARGLADLLPVIEVINGNLYNADPNRLSDYPDDISADAPVTEIPVPFVDLPIGATEDRVLGSLDFEAALREGRRVFHPGLLAAANRGILYIDEVNLLPAHLVDVLLDAAAMGVNTVQREGITITHPAQFILIGTMNPEEGDLRPQLLDRFGLMIDVAAPRDPELRTEVVRRRIAFEMDSVEFAAQWKSESEHLRERIIAAQKSLPQVRLSDELLLLISRICAEFDVDGLRADITLHKTARALAAWEGRFAVNKTDIERAALWVLAHRRRRQPFEQPGMAKDKLQDIIKNPPPDFDKDDDETTNSNDDEADGSASEQSKTQVFTASQLDQIKKLRLQAQYKKTTMGEGRRNPISGMQQGHYSRAVVTDKADDLAIDATLRAASINGHDAGKPIITPADYRKKLRTSTTGSLILFVVDASGSMAARKRMEAVKGAVLSLLLDAYQQRDRVAVIAFRGTHAEVLLPPTNSVELAEKSLQTLPTGGRTPLAHALLLAKETIHKAQRDDSDLLPFVILLSDGKANIALDQGDAWDDTQQSAGLLTNLQIPTLVLDTEMGYVRIGRAQTLADWLGAEYLRLDDLSGDTLTLTIRRRMS